MTERPILFSAPMVRALLAGTKTQTRRIVKHGLPEVRSANTSPVKLGEWAFYSSSGRDFASLACPYGVPGDVNGRRAWLANPWVWAVSFERADA